jgi:hypothetical protein
MRRRWPSSRWGTMGFAYIVIARRMPFDLLLESTAKNCATTRLAQLLSMG